MAKEAARALDTSHFDFFRIHIIHLLCTIYSMMCSVETVQWTVFVCYVSSIYSMCSTIQVTVVKFTQCSAMKDTMQLRRENRVFV